MYLFLHAIQLTQTFPKFPQTVLPTVTHAISVCSVARSSNVFIPTIQQFQNQIYFQFGILPFQSINYARLMLTLSAVISKSFSALRRTRIVIVCRNILVHSDWLLAVQSGDRIPFGDINYLQLWVSHNMAHSDHVSSYLYSLYHYSSGSIIT
jgi:hypothetical protein